VAGLNRKSETSKSSRNGGEKKRTIRIRVQILVERNLRGKKGAGEKDRQVTAQADGIDLRAGKSSKE